MLNNRRHCLFSGKPTVDIETPFWHGMHSLTLNEMKQITFQHFKFRFDFASFRNDQKLTREIIRWRVRCWFEMKPIFHSSDNNGIDETIICGMKQKNKTREHWLNEPQHFKANKWQYWVWIFKMFAWIHTQTHSPEVKRTQEKANRSHAITAYRRTRDAGQNVKRN